MTPVRNPKSWTEAAEDGISSVGGQIRVVQENYPYRAHFVSGLTTGGVSFSAVTSSTSISTKSSNYKTVLSSTISWPGLEAKNIDEADFSLVCDLRTTQASSSASSMGYVWQWKNSSQTTWTNLSTIRTLKSTAWVTRTVSGYKLHRDSGVAAGYNRLPINIRLRFYNKTASKGRIRVRGTSYVEIKPR